MNGLTASHNRGGRYFRARVIPTNPNTARQVQVRANLGTAANTWNTITPAQRTAWNLYGSQVSVINAVGESILLSGQQWFIAATTFALDAIDGGAAVTVPVPAPVIFNRGEVTPGLATLGLAAGLSVALGGTFEGDVGDGAISVYQGRPQNAGVSFYKGPWRRAFTTTTSAFVSPATVATALLPYPIALGQRVWLQARALISDGRLSAAVIVGPLTVVA